MFPVKFVKPFLLGVTAISLSITPLSGAYAGKNDKNDKNDKKEEREDEEREDAIKGAVVGAGVGALVGGTEGAVVGGVAGAIIGKNR